MASKLAVYVLIHQPRRLRIPAVPIPQGCDAEALSHVLFDEPLNRHYLERVAERCYRPAIPLFRSLVERGFKLNLALSFSFLRQAQAWTPDVVASLRELLAHPNVELVGSEPYHSFLFYADLPGFLRGMDWMRRELAREFGGVPRVTDTTELFMSTDLYYALKAGGWEGALLDGRPSVLAGELPTRRYRSDSGPSLFVRHTDLSDDVGFRFANRSWSGWPLTADRYAEWIAGTPGEFVFVGWDFETFGEHLSPETGIFHFLLALPDELRRRGIECATFAELGSGTASHLPLPARPVTWASDGDTSFFFGNRAQQPLFELMHHAVHVAQLSGDPYLLDVAHWLCQSDHLHLLQWYGCSEGIAGISEYFTPREWWPLGHERIVRELFAVYEGFIAEAAFRIDRGLQTEPPSDDRFPTAIPAPAT